MSSVARGWRRPLQVYGLMLGSLFVGSQIVHRVLAPDMSVEPVYQVEVPSAPKEKESH